MVLKGGGAAGGSAYSWIRSCNQSRFTYMQGYQQRAFWRKYAYFFEPVCPKYKKRTSNATCLLL